MLDEDFVRRCKVGDLCLRFGSAGRRWMRRWWRRVASSVEVAKMSIIGTCAAGSSSGVFGAFGVADDRVASGLLLESEVSLLLSLPASEELSESEEVEEFETESLSLSDELLVLSAGLARTALFGFLPST